jgi:fucose permease
MVENFSSNADNSAKKIRVIPTQFIFPFILVTTLFSLWGFANDITNPMVAAFKNILLINNFQSSLVQFAFYGGYCVMAIPAALFIKRFTYKKGILVGLALYAAGCLMFIPSGKMMAFPAFLLSYFVMTCGLSFLETSANPYILSMGPEETSTRRLNFAQSFNPMGSILGMFVASQIILANLNPTTEMGRRYIQSASEGTTYHAKVQSDSLESLKEAQKILANVGESGLSAKAADDVLASAENAKNLLQSLSSETSDQAFEIQKILDDKEADDDTKDAARKRLKELFVFTSERMVFFDSYRTLLDVAILAKEEAPLLTAAGPQSFPESRTQAVSALEELKAICPTLKTNSEASKVDVGALQTQLAESITLLENADKKLAEIPADTLAKHMHSEGERLTDIKKRDLNVIIGPYAVLGIVLLVILVVFTLAKLPKGSGEDDKQLHIAATLKRLLANRKYVEGVIAQAFYVGVQIMCWTFIIQYAGNELGMEKAVAQRHNIVAMVFFVSSRFVCTFLLKYISPGALLRNLAIGGFGLILGVIFIRGIFGLYCLMGVSMCMSLMFPTIYGIALKGLGDDAKLGAAGLIMAIGGGSIMPPMQAAIMDMDAFNLGFVTLSSTRASFVLPLICFVVIAWYGWNTHRKHTD